MGKQWKQVRYFILGDFKITADGDCSHESKRHLLIGREKSYDQPRQRIKKQGHYFINKGLSSQSQSYGFSCSHVWMWKLDYKESMEDLMLLNCGVEKAVESPLDYKDIQPVHPKGNQSWIFIGRTDAEAETPILWPPDAKNQLIGKDPDAGKDCRQEEKGTTEDEMGWMAPLTRWTWVWVGSRSWWWTGKSWTGLSDWTELKYMKFLKSKF